MRKEEDLCDFCLKNEGVEVLGDLWLCHRCFKKLKKGKKIMGFEPVDFSEEKKELEEKLSRSRKGDSAHEKSKEVMQFDKVSQEIAEFIESVAEGSSPFRKQPVQKNTLICTKVLERIKRLKHPTTQDVELFVKTVQQDLGKACANHVHSLIFREKKNEKVV